MPGVSQYERLLADALLLSEPRPPVEEGVGLFVTPAGGDGKVVFDLAVLPAMRKNDLNGSDVRIVFDDMSSLAEVCRFVQIAEVIVADLWDLNPAVLYVGGLCHGLKRCPIVLTRHTTELPFNFHVLRGVEYANTKDGLFELRERLERVLRVFLHAARKGGT
jgi:hypothetical protein